jgi:hypothetical protein
MQQDTRIFLHELLYNPQHERGRYTSGAANLHFAGCRVGQEFDVSDALFKLIKRCHSALEQGMPEYCRLDALRAPIEKPNAQRMLQISYDL